MTATAVLHQIAAARTANTTQVNLRNYVINPKTGHLCNITITIHKNSRYGLNIVNKSTSAITEYFSLNEAELCELLGFMPER